MAEYLLPQLAEELLERAPMITLKLSIGQDDVLREALRAGRLDAIIYPLVSNDPDFKIYPVLQDEAVVVASAEHPIFSAPFNQQELCRYQWVLPGPMVTARRWIDNAFISRQLPAPTVQIETNSISLLPGLIARTRLLSFLARETLEYGQGMFAT